MKYIRGVLMFSVMSVWMKKQVSETRHEGDSWCVNVFRDSIWMKQQVSETRHDSDSWCVNVFRDARLDEDSTPLK